MTNTHAPPKASSNPSGAFYMGLGGIPWHQPLGGNTGDSEGSHEHSHPAIGSSPDMKSNDVALMGQLDLIINLFCNEKTH